MQLYLILKCHATVTLLDVYRIKQIVYAPANLFFFPNSFICFHIIYRFIYAKTLQLFSSSYCRICVPTIYMFNLLIHLYVIGCVVCYFRLLQFFHLFLLIYYVLCMFKMWIPLGF